MIICSQIFPQMCKTYHHLPAKHLDFCATLLKTLFCVPVIAIILVMTLCKWHPSILKACYQSWQLSYNMLAFPRGMSVRFPSCTLLFHLRYVHARVHTASGGWNSRAFLLGAPEEFHHRIPAEAPKQDPYIPLSLVTTYSTCLLLLASGLWKCRDLVISQNHTCSSCQLVC